MKKARSASKTRIKDTQAKKSPAYVKPSNRPSQYYNSNGGLWYGESMFCESNVPYRGSCANCGASVSGFYCDGCR